MAKKLFIGGLSWDTTDAKLSEFFSQAGGVVSASVVMDRYSGKSRGFGFVEMASDAEADQAVQKLNGQMLDGRTIVVNEARPQEPRTNFPPRSFDRRGSFGGGDRRGGDRRDNRSRY